MWSFSESCLVLRFSRALQQQVLQAKYEKKSEPYPFINLNLLPFGFIWCCLVFALWGRIYHLFIVRCFGYFSLVHLNGSNRFNFFHHDWDFCMLLQCKKIKKTIRCLPFLSLHICGQLFTCSISVDAFFVIMCPEKIWHCKSS